MRHTFSLVAALGLIAATGPSALAQDQETPSSQPTTPATLPATYTQPAMPGQVVSPYAPMHPGMVTPCGGIMPSAHVPGTVMYGPQFPPSAAYGSFPQMMSPNPVMMQYGQPGMQYAQPGMQYAQPGMQYGQPTVMPVAGSVAGGVMPQPYQTGTPLLSGTTFQPSQPGMMQPSGMTYQPTQPGMVFPAGQMGAYPDQPLMLTGYTDTGMTTQPARRGLFGRRR